MKQITVLALLAIAVPLCSGGVPALVGEKAMSSHLVTRNADPFPVVGDAVDVVAYVAESLDLLTKLQAACNAAATALQNVVKQLYPVNILLVAILVIVISIFGTLATCLNCNVLLGNGNLGKVLLQFASGIMIIVINTIGLFGIIFAALIVAFGDILDIMCKLIPLLDYSILYVPQILDYGNQLVVKINAVVGASSESVTQITINSPTCVNIGSCDPYCSNILTYPIDCDCYGTGYCRYAAAAGSGAKK